MRSIATKTTYLQMLTPPPAVCPPPRDDLRVTRLVALSPSEYREIYRAVGANLHWVDRLRMADDELRAIISHPLVEIYLLQVADQPAGFAELDRREADQIELAYFGLYPEYIGQGLGKYFLGWAIQQAWSQQPCSQRPRRLWVHTCDLDHAAALPNYVKAGFVPYREEIIDQMVL